MVRRLASKLTLGLFCAGGASGFVPFGDVEELKPRRLHDFCGEEKFPSPDGRGHVRRCAHQFKKTLQDRSELELQWQMEVDPDSILSLDTEAELGVRLTRCTEGELEIELPKTHIGHVAEGKIIVGSRFVHSCGHREDSTIVHRVKEVRARQWRSGKTPAAPQTAWMRLATEELSSWAEVVPNINIGFSWMPVEAREPLPVPESPTDFGQSRRQQEVARRRLQIPGFPGGFQAPAGLSTDTGTVTQNGKSGGELGVSQGVVSLQPKQVSNFGWNWNFNMNSSNEPDIALNVPGASGLLKVRQPTIDVHQGIYLNFSSQFVGLTMPPHVVWTVGTKGNGVVAARVLGTLNTTDQSANAPLHAFKLPIGQRFEKPQWFQMVDFATGSLPIKMQPGFQLTASMYHRGHFNGVVGLGGRTQGTINPMMTYDSLRGVDCTFGGELTDTQVFPPIWMIFTKAFEMGIILKPSLLMKGDFAGLEKATMAIEGRPYMNISIDRQGDGANVTAGGAAGATQTLTVYPIRVLGISSIDFTKKYVVSISCNGQVVKTSAQVNFGEVEFRDHISNFNCGSIAQSTLTDSATQFTVSLLQVDSSNPLQQTVLGSGTVGCASLLAGECQPSPSSVMIISSLGETLATIQLVMFWGNTPATWFLSKIRGVSLSFPEVTLRQDYLSQAFPKLTAGDTADGLSLQLVLGGQSWPVELEGQIGSALAGQSVLQLGPIFTDLILPCQSNVQLCTSPQLELYVGSQQVGVATVPVINFDPQGSSSGSSSSGGGFLAAGSTGSFTSPTTLAMNAPGDTGVTVALVTMNVYVVSTPSSSVFLNPRYEEQVAVGATFDFVWMVAGMSQTAEYKFTLLPYKLSSDPPTNTQAYTAYRKVNGQVLVPVQTASQTSGQKCQSRALGSVPAGQTPCTFAYSFALKGFSDGDIVVLEISWSQDGSTNVMYAAPIEVTSSGSRRLWAAEAGPEEEAEAEGRRLAFDRNVWNQRIQSLGDACTKKDLHFDVGMGMLMRGRVVKLAVPKGFPMSGMSNNPGLSTGFRQIASFKPGKDLEDLLGGKNGLMCQAGMCQGLLPGCNQANQQKMSFPKIVLDFNRPFHFSNKTGHFNGLLKQALAYAFSTLPEMVDVMIKHVNETGFARGQKQGKPKPTENPLGWFGGGSGQQSGLAPAPSPSGFGWATSPVQTAPAPAPSGFFSAPAPQQQPSLPAFGAQAAPAAAPAAAPDPSLTDVFNKWWGGGGSARRLGPKAPEPERATVPGSREELPRELQANQAFMHFHRGSPFIIDRTLVELLLRFGYFDHVEDVHDDAVNELGPLYITRFYVDSGVEDDGGDEALGSSPGIGGAGRAERLGAGGPPRAEAIAFAAALVAFVGGVSLAALKGAAPLRSGRHRAGKAACAGGGAAEAFAAEQRELSGCSDGEGLE